VTFSYDAPVIEAEACAAVMAEAENPPVDIIWIIDQSCSMGGEIAQVRDSINVEFAGVIAASGLDYRVIMVADSSGSNSVCVDPPLGAATCGAANLPRFYQENRHIESSDSFVRFQERWGNIQPFLRADAIKFFIEVTDDQSSMTSQNFDTWLLTGAGAGYFGDAAQRRYIFNSIVGVKDPHGPGDPLETTKCSSAVNTGSRYQELSILTGGLRHPVCDTDYTAVFNAIAANVISAVACELQMPTTDGGIIDYAQVEVIYQPSGGGPAQSYGQVADEPSCAGGDGFYYDNPASPTRVYLCPAACATVQADAGAQVTLSLGCLGS
jgi:hypothetical protein